MYFAEIVSMVKDVVGGGDDLLARAGEVAGRFVAEGLTVPGELHRTGFVAWSVAPAAAAERIRREVAQMVRDGVRPTLGSVCWFVLGEAVSGGSPAE
ncbi:hypothetical protein [Goodfellowiella coeruleoviolacea]|uniref:hypothetical protein n=1 Tax=Goodfellowiella coeruleoviolacea TaxID=334858 RepID=UPI0020A333D9|nr:hypothetical protein [Goodfellowiella coeruleoviolacea]